MQCINIQWVLDHKTSGCHIKDIFEAFGNCSLDIIALILIFLGI